MESGSLLKWVDMTVWSSRTHIPVFNNFCLIWPPPKIQLYIAKYICKKKKKSNNPFVHWEDRGSKAYSASCMPHILLLYLPLRAMCGSRVFSAFPKLQSRQVPNLCPQGLTPILLLWILDLLFQSRQTSSRTATLYCTLNKVKLYELSVTQERLCHEYWLVKRAFLPSGWQMKCKDRYFWSFGFKDWKKRWWEGRK